MKMNHTCHKLAAILLSLLLFTENAGIFSSVSAEELTYDNGISCESMLEENSAAADIPCYESGDVSFDASCSQDFAGDNDLNKSYGQDQLTGESSAFANEAPAFENDELSPVNEEDSSEQEESVFANEASALADEYSAANEEPMFAEETLEMSGFAAEEAAFADEGEAIVSEDEILTGDTYGEALLQEKDGLSRAPAEGNDEDKGGDNSESGVGSIDRGKSEGSDGSIDSGKSESGNGSKDSDKNEGHGEISGVLVNPLYAHLYDESSIAAEEASFAWDEAASANFPAYKDEATAAALVRSSMKERTDTFGFSVSGSMSKYGSENELRNALTEIAKTISNAALEHTGNPTEGDYIAYQFGYMTYGSQYSYSSTAFSADIIYNVRYYTNASQEASVTKKVNTVLTQLKLNGKSEYEKILAIYDYICRNVRYDDAHAYNPAYELQFTAYAALINGTAVCQGYAVLLYRMLLESGIDCRVIDGIGGGESHAWNIARLGSLYYNMDATWDSPDYADGPVTHEWFLKGKGTALFPDHQAKGRSLKPSFIAAYPISLENYDPAQGAVVLPGRIRAAAVAQFTDLSGNARTQKSYSASNTVMIYGRSSCTASNQMLKTAVETAKSANTGSKIIFLGIDDADDGIYDLANQYPGVTFSPASAANNSTMWELVSLCGLEPQNGTLYLPATFVFDRYGNTAYAFTGEEPDKLSACMEYGSFDERLALGDAGFVVSLEDNIFLYKGSAIKPAVMVLRKTGETAPLTAGTDYKVTYSNNNAPGNATAIVSGMNGFTGQLTAAFRILEPVASFSSTKVSLNKKKSKTIYLTVTNGDSLKLSLSNNNISANASTENASLNKSTLRVTIPITITAGSTAGTTKITATTGTGKKASCTITVNKTKTKSISTSKTTYKVKKGETVSLNAKVSPTNSDEPISYKCANTAIATVSSKGVVKGKKKGTTKVTISSGSVKKTVTIKVTQ